MNRRNFLKGLSAAAPMLFLPKLITVAWKPVRVEYRIIPGTYTPEIEKILNYNKFNRDSLILMAR